MLVNPRSVLQNVLCTVANLYWARDSTILLHKTAELFVTKSTLQCILPLQGHKYVCHLYMTNVCLWMIKWVYTFRFCYLSVCLYIHLSVDLSNYLSRSIHHLSGALRNNWDYKIIKQILKYIKISKEVSRYLMTKLSTLLTYLFYKTQRMRTVKQYAEKSLCCPPRPSAIFRWYEGKSVWESLLQSASFRKGTEKKINQLSG